MYRLVKDMVTLTHISLPNSFDRKRVILNFLVLYLKSLTTKFSNLQESTSLKRQHNVKIESTIWQSFNRIIEMYVAHLSPKYLLETYIIRGVATGWHSKSYIDFLKQNFTQKHIEQIPEILQEKVTNVATSLSKEFTGMEQETVNRWLSTYQFGLSSYHKDKTELLDTLENTIVIELGAGTGANAAVHASVSKQGVYIFDIPPMLQIQEQVINKVSKTIQLSDVSYYHDVDELISAASKQPYIVVSYWAFTEFPEELRKSLDPLIQNSKFSFFACNSHFEGINNLDYFEELSSRLENKSVESKSIDWNPYKKHSYVMVR